MRKLPPNEKVSSLRNEEVTVEHRDTGENIGSTRPQDTYRVRHTTLKDCGDLLREWGVGARSFV